MNLTLVVVEGAKAGMEIPISTPRFLVGRGADCQLRPRCSLVGERHCAISVDKDSSVIEDYGSAHGTFVNGRRVERQRTLEHGDRIKIGTLEFEVRLAANEQSKTESCRVPAVEASASGALEDPEARVAGWLEEGSEGQREAEGNEASEIPQPAPAAIRGADTQTRTSRDAVAPNPRAWQAKTLHAYEASPESDAIDYLLFTAIVVLSVVILVMLFPLLPGLLKWCLGLPKWMWRAAGRVPWWIWTTTGALVLMVLAGIHAWNNR